VLDADLETRARIAHDIALNSGYSLTDAMRMLTDATDRDARMRAEGERAATNRIVKWLRRPLTGSAEFIEDNRRNRHDMADAIEAGEHQEAK
jgi:hypothetical protein